jgi:hypothetical protein
VIDPTLLLEKLKSLDPDPPKLSGTAPSAPRET